jgi:hypothetical protein
MLLRLFQGSYCKVEFLCVFLYFLDLRVKCNAPLEFNGSIPSLFLLPWAENIRNSRQVLPRDCVNLAPGLTRVFYFEHLKTIFLSFFKKIYIYVHIDNNAYFKSTKSQSKIHCISLYTKKTNIDLDV